MNTKLVWDEIKSHTSLLLTIIIFSGMFFWITPIITHELIYPTEHLQLQLGDLFYMIIIGAIIGIRMVIITE
jgi:hypothetical protein